MLLGPPIELQPDEAICDVYACSRSAVALVPGCAVCHEHAETYGVGVSDEYEIPYGDLVGGDDWREARYRQYEERARDFPPMRRDPRRDDLLGRIIARNVERLLCEREE